MFLIYCLDRHVLADNGSRVAFYWENEKGNCRIITYKDMYDEVNRLANYYKSLGLKKEIVSLFICLAMLAVEQMKWYH